MAAAAAPIADMDEYLQQRIGVANLNMRQRIIAAGFEDLDELAKKDNDFAHKCCQVVRKSTGGFGVNKDISMIIEDGMVDLVLWCRYMYLAQRPLDFDTAERDHTESVGAWLKQTAEDPSVDSVDKFSDRANKKVWFETIVGYFRDKKGTAGVPLLYVISENALVPDEGFGQPDYNQELAVRGRQNGYYWRGDNTQVWIFLKLKTQNTTAWSTIKSYERSSNGRAAFQALLDQFMGASVKTVIYKSAEYQLQTLVWDGRSRNFDFNKFIGRLRGAFDDMGDNRYTEEMKVTKLLAAFQYAPLSHLEATIANDPRLRDNFNATAAFIQAQLNALKLKNGARGRNLDAGTTVAPTPPTIDTEEHPAPDTEETPTARLKTLKRKLKQMKKKLKAKAKEQGKAVKKNTASKFTRGNPGAYIPRSEWNKLNDEQKEAARKARKASGIKSITTVSKDDDDMEEDGSDDEINICTVKQEEDTKPPAVPPGLLRAPTYKVAATTQREALYASSPRKVAWSLKATKTKDPPTNTRTPMEPKET